MQPGVLLDVAELFEPPVAIGTFIGLLPRVHPDMLD